MNFKECKEKYPIGSYLIVKQKTNGILSWFQVQNYIVSIKGKFLSVDVYPSHHDSDGNCFIYDPERYDIINVFPTFKDAEPYISRI